jgi:RNA polymerase sigma factor (sigma-70 family)
MSFIAARLPACPAPSATENPIALKGYPRSTAQVMTLAPAKSAPAASHNALLEQIARSQDRQAFSLLFDHFAPRLNAYMRKLGTDAAQAEELVQEAMLLVWRKAGSFDPAKASASTWIFTIARNKRIDALRRARHPEFDPTDPALAGFGGGSEEAHEPEVSAQESRALEAAIATLPAEQADLLRLAYFEDKAHGEIARVRGIPLGTVKSRLRLALEKLRRQLNSKDI